MGWWWEKKEFRWCGCQNRRKKRKFSEKKTWRISILELLNFIYPWSTYTTQPISKLTIVLLVSWNSDKKRRKEREMMGWWWEKKEFQWCDCWNRRKKKKFSDKKPWRISVLGLPKFICPWPTNTAQH